MARLLAPLFILLSFAWLALLVTAPSVTLGVPLTTAAYAFGAAICHQLPDRSFHLGAAQVPVCARCLGLYAGAAIGAVWAALAPRPVGGRAMLVLAALPTGGTWLAEALTLAEPSNVTRFVAALPLGAAVVAVAVSTVNYEAACARLRQIPSRPAP